MKYYYDLHMHSDLSPCGDGDMTPNNIVNMAKLNGLDVIALSDHNTSGNLRAAARVAEQVGIIFVPGMELETAEEIHVLCLFPDVDSAERFDKEVVSPALPDVPNNERIFGFQHFLDENDEITGCEPRYLLNATSISVDNVRDLVSSYGGVAVPAHVDKQTKSIISVFGMVDKSMGFRTLELSVNAPEDFPETQFSLKGENYFYLHDSDAHYLYHIAEPGDKNFFEFEAPPAPKDIINLLKNGMGS